MAARRQSMKGHRNIYYRPGTRPRVYEVGYRDSSGAQRFETVRVRGNLEAALELRDQVLGRKRRGEVVRPSAATFTEVAALWLDSQAQLRPRTRATYETSLNVHLLPRFGRRRVASITEDDVAVLMADLRDGRGPDGKERRPLAAWTIRGVLVVLSRVMSYAARRGMIAANPVSKLERGERPRVERREMRVLDTAQVERFLGAAPKAYRAILATSVFTGVRQGEALGLTWADVDFANGLVHVRGQLDRSRERTVGKTRAARREVVLMPALARLLREHKAASRFSRDSDFVFCTATGRPLYYRNVSRRGFEVAAIAAGINPPKPKKGEPPPVSDGQPRFRWHDMRNTFASILIAEGLDVVYVSRQLGHADPSITLKVYAHLFDRARHADRARDALEARFGSSLAAPEQPGDDHPDPDHGRNLLRLQAKRV